MVSARRELGPYYIRPVPHLVDEEAYTVFCLEAPLATSEGLPISAACRQAAYHQIRGMHRLPGMRGGMSRASSAVYVRSNTSGIFGARSRSPRMGHGSNGLGLHIVHNLVTNVLGGTIEAASDAGQTRFIVRCPCVAPALANRYGVVRDIG